MSSPGPCHHLDHVITWTMSSPGPCHHLDHVITWTMSSPGPCHHLDHVITGTMSSPGPCHHLAAGTLERTAWRRLWRRRSLAARAPPRCPPAPPCLEPWPFWGCIVQGPQNFNTILTCSNWRVNMPQYACCAVHVSNIEY
jgi:hypothetical protein